MRPLASAVLAVFTLAALGLACSPPPPCSAVGVGGVGAAPFGQLEKYDVADPDHDIAVTVTLGGSSGPFTAGSCTPPPKPTSLRVEVSDPLNGKVQATSSIVSDDPPAARVSFRAPVAGRYHVYVIFEPNLGTSQVDALVVRDARKAQTLAIADKCETMQTLANGTLLCVADTSGSSGTVQDQPVLLRPDGARLTLDAGASWIASGDTLWAYGQAGVQRYVDTGAGMLPAPTELAFASPSDDVQQLLATDTELWVLTTTELRRFAFDTSTSQLRVAGSASVQPSPAAMVRGTSSMFVLSDFGDGKPKAQQFSVAGDAVTPSPTVQTLSGAARGVDAQGFWLGPDEASTASAGGTFTGSMAYLTVQEEQLRSVLVFGLPGGYTARPPTGMFASPGRRLSFTGGVPGIAPAASTTHFGGTPTVALLLPRYDGRNVAYDLVSENPQLNLRFGQFGESVWVGEGDGTANGSGTRVLQRGK